MPRRINFTGRQRILRKHARIQLECERGYPPRFDAELDLSDYRFANDDVVTIQAYTGQGKLLEFEYGRCAEIRSPRHTWLNGFDESDRTKFRVLVTATEPVPGLLRGGAEGIRPSNLDDDQISLLPLGRSKLDEEVWALEFPDVSTDPVRLLIDEQILDHKGFASTPSFRALVLPQALRQILTAICIPNTDLDRQDFSDWRTRWVIFAERLAGEMPPNEDRDFVERWIDDAVARFASQSRLKTRLLQSDGGT